MMLKAFRFTVPSLLMGRKSSFLHTTKLNCFYKKNFNIYSSMSINSNQSQRKQLTVNFPLFCLPGIDTMQPLNLPSGQKYIEIFDSIPLSNINLPSLPETRTVKLPTLENNLVIHCKGGLLRIRRKKMNKHKLKKRRKRDRAKIRKVLMGRDKQKRKKRAKRKIKLEEKIEKLLKDNPESTYAERPYVIHRLKNW